MNKPENRIWLILGILFLIGASIELYVIAKMPTKTYSITQYSDNGTILGNYTTNRVYHRNNELRFQTNDGTQISISGNYKIIKK